MRRDPARAIRARRSSINSTAARGLSARCPHRRATAPAPFASARRPLGTVTPALQQDRAQLVDQTPCARHQPVARPMQRLHVELRPRLQLDEPHRRPGRRLGDRLRIAVVVLLRLHVGPDILRRHQPHLVALRPRTAAAEVMRAAARLHRHDAARQLRGEADQRLRFMRRRRTTAPEASRPTTLQQSLPRSIPSTAICMHCPSSLNLRRSYTPGGGAGHSIKLRSDAEGASGRPAAANAC